MPAPELWVALPGEPASPGCSSPIVRPYVVAGTVAILAGAALLSRMLATTTAARWCFGAVLALGWTGSLVARALAAGRTREHRSAGSKLGLANRITLGRGILLALLAGFVFVPVLPALLLWVPAALYGLNALADGLDGYVARVEGGASELGSRLDTGFDASGLLIASLVAVQLGRLPAWYLVLGAAYYVMTATMALARFLGRPVYPERNVPSLYRRLFAGLHMVLITAALVPISSKFVVATVAIVWTVPVVLDFIATITLLLGWITLEGIYARVLREIRRWGLERAPLAARLIGATAALWSGSGLPAVVPPAVALLLTGIAGRGAAAVILVAMAIRTPSLLSSSHAVLIASAAIVLFCGSGPWSLWRPEDRLLLRRPGESR